jgi:hypothetical protein
VPADERLGTDDSKNPKDRRKRRDKPYRDIALELTNRNTPTPRGGNSWNAMSVMRAMRRLGLGARSDIGR